MKQRKNKRIKSIEEYLELGKDQRTLYETRYKKSLDNARSSGNEEELINKLNIKTGYYSLRTRIIKNPWVKHSPATKASSWLSKDVFRNPAEYRYSQRMIYQGGLFIFEYLNPKYKGTSVLPWFDKYPLVVSLGPIVTKQGIRNIGFNLHLLPPKIRVIVLCIIFEMYKKLYRYQVFFKQTRPVNVNYKKIVGALDHYGVKFCVRMYIPQRMNNIVRFPIKDWHKAVFIPSKGYDGIRANKLIKEWRLFCRKNGFSTRENMDWKTVI